MNKKKTVVMETVIKSPISVSVENNSNVFNGQTIYLVVEVNADLNVLKKINNFSIKSNLDSIYVQSNYDFSIVTSSGKLYGHATFFLTINNKKMESQVNFIVNAFTSQNTVLNEITPLSITYNVLKNIPQNLIKLKTENEFIAMPEHGNPIDNPKSKYNLYMGKLVDISNNPLKNIQVMISCRKPGQLLTPLVHITTDSGKGKIGELIKIGKMENIDFFVTQSDEYGNIKFRVYPIRDIEVRVDFYIQLVNVTQIVYATSIYVFRNFSNHNNLDNPFILELQEGGILEKTSEIEYFKATINSYTGVNNSDGLVFFIQNDVNHETKALYPTYLVDDKTTLEDRNFHFSYDQLQPNQSAGFYYMVIPREGETRYSQALYVKYVHDSPDVNKNEVYKKAAVYSSYVKPNIIKPSNRIGLVFESSAVIFDTITQGLVFGEGIDNRKSAGLYVMIQLADSVGENDLPQPNQNGKIRVTIISSNDPVSEEYDFNSKTLKQDGSTKYHLVTIPFCFLKGVLLREGGIPSRLHIQYYAITNQTTGDKTQSKVWECDMNTMDPDDYDDNYYYGCSVNP